jgi:DNA-binding MarR family transcriptional regulator
MTMSLSSRGRGKRTIDAASAIKALLPLECAAEPQAYFAATPPAELAHSHVFFWLTIVTGRRDRLLAQQFRRLGVRVGEWRVLTALTIRPNIPMTEVAELASFDPTTLTRSVDRMARAGWVKRAPDPKDMRLTRLALTPAGVKLFDKLWVIADRINQALCEYLPSGTPQLMCLALREMLRGLDQIADSGIDQVSNAETGNGATRSAA